MEYNDFLVFVKQLNNIPSFSGKIKFSNNHFNKIGSGSGRVVYDIDGTKVFKLAKNSKGVAQNDVESNIGYYSDTHHIVTQVFDSADDNSWIISEKGKKVNEKRIIELTGIPNLSQLEYYLKNFISRNNGGEDIFKQNDSVIKLLNNNEFTNDLENFISNYSQSAGDINRSSTYGEVLHDGQPTIVLTDYGLNDEVYQNYYQRKPKRSLYEEIDSNEANNTNNSIKTVIEGKRSVGWTDLTQENIDDLKNGNIGVLIVRIVSNQLYKCIIYTDEEKAIKLHNIAKQKNGYLKDTTPDEAREIGELLGYSKESVNRFIQKKYFKDLPVEKTHLDYNDLDEQKSLSLYNIVKLTESEEDYYDREDELKFNIFQDFLYNNTPDFTKHVPWVLIPYPRLKKIWEDYMKRGVVRDERGLEMIENIMVNNTMKVSIFTQLAGHTQWSGDGDFEENIGYWVDEQLNCIFEKPFDKNQLEIPFENPNTGYKEKEDTTKCNTTIHPFVQQYFDENYNGDVDEFRKSLYKEMLDRFFDYYQNDPEQKLGGFISDFGLKPLLTLLQELMRGRTHEEKLVTIDKMLNVLHQRSDIASWFVQGGSRALSQLSGYQTDDKDSVISGNYRMGDYRNENKRLSLLNLI